MKKLALFLMFLTIFLTPSLTFAEDGKCIEGDCETGKGTLTWSGRKYVGEFKDWVLNGQGTFTAPEVQDMMGNGRMANSTVWELRHI